MPSQKPDISKNILQNVLRKHIHVTSLADNIQTKYQSYYQYQFTFCNLFLDIFGF